MFFKGSRYKDLPEVHVVNAGGEAIRSKALRWIPDTPGTFLHTVNQSDRLDLLAYKYYGDSKKWWPLCDANPEYAFPTDLLDRAPFIQETFYIKHALSAPTITSGQPGFGFGHPAYGPGGFPPVGGPIITGPGMVMYSWPALITELKKMRGVQNVLADTFQKALEVTYNHKELEQEKIIKVITSKNFRIKEIIKKERVGQKIVIPPNKVV